MKRISLAAAIVAIAIVAIIMTYSGTVSAPVEAVPKDDGLTDAERRELQNRIANTVRVRGTVETVNPLLIRSRLEPTGVIISLVKDGKRVKKGDVILQFDDSKVKEDLSVQTIVVAQAQAELKRAEANLASAKSVTTEKLNAAKLHLEAAELAQSAYLAKDGEYQLELKAIESEIQLAITRASVGKRKANAGTPGAEAEILAATNDQKLAQLKKTLLTTHTLKQKTAEFAAGVAARKAELLQTDRENASEKISAEADLRARMTALQVELVKRKRIEQQLKNCVIRAPRDGHVLYVNNSTRRTPGVVIAVGNTMREREKLFSMPDLENLKVTTAVHGINAHRVKKGQSVKIRFDALPDTVVEGTVTGISDVPHEGAWPNTDLKMYDVEIMMKKPPKALKIGMSGSVEINVKKSR